MHCIMEQKWLQMRNATFSWLNKEVRCICLNWCCCQMLFWYTVCYWWWAVITNSLRTSVTTAGQWVQQPSWSLAVQTHVPGLQEWQIPSSYSVFTSTHLKVAFTCCVLLWGRAAVLKLDLYSDWMVSLATHGWKVEPKNEWWHKDSVACSLLHVDEEFAVCVCVCSGGSGIIMKRNWQAVHHLSFKPQSNNSACLSLKCNINELKSIGHQQNILIN